MDQLQWFQREKHQFYAYNIVFSPLPPSFSSIDSQKMMLLFFLVNSLHQL